MTDSERAKEYLLDSLTETEIEKELSDITTKFMYELINKDTILKLISEIQAYMEILEIEKKVKYWRVDESYDMLGIVFKVYEDELNLTIKLHN